MAVKQQTDVDHLRDLSRRLMHVPVMFGTNQLDAERLVATVRRLIEAEWLIRELDAHEGAEGWSQYLRERLDKYEFATRDEDHKL